MITIWFQNADFYGDGVEDKKFLNVYYKDELISACISINNATCNEYQYCLADYPLDDSPLYFIPSGEQITIQIQKGRDSGIPSGCEYSLWADVTLKCGGTAS